MQQHNQIKTNNWIAEVLGNPGVSGKGWQDCCATCFSWSELPWHVFCYSYCTSFWRAGEGDDLLLSFPFSQGCQVPRFNYCSWHSVSSEHNLNWKEAPEVVWILSNQSSSIASSRCQEQSTVIANINNYQFVATVNLYIILSLFFFKSF